MEMGRCREIGGMRDRKWAVERDGGMKWVVYSYILYKVGGLEMRRWRGGGMMGYGNERWKGVGRRGGWEWAVERGEKERGMGMGGGDGVEWRGMGMGDGKG